MALNTNRRARQPPTRRHVIAKCGALALLFASHCPACTRAASAPTTTPYLIRDNDEARTLNLARAICPNNAIEIQGEIGCTSCSSADASSGNAETRFLRRKVDRRIVGHFTSNSANEELVLMSGCEPIGAAEVYLLSLTSGQPQILSRTVNGSPDHVEAFRRRDGRTGIVSLSRFSKQGWQQIVVKTCSIGTGSVVECKDLLFGVSARNRCPPEEDLRTDVDEISLALADADGDGVSDISLRIEYSAWPVLTRREAYRLALSTGCAVDVRSPPAERAPEPTRGSTTLVYLNRADRFEPTTETLARLKVLGPQARQQP